MKSLKQQITILVVSTILIMAACFMAATVVQIKETAVLAATTKAKSDLATGQAILNVKYPGSWRIEDGVLYKGDMKMNNNVGPVDYISTLTGDTCTIFLGNTRVTTTIRKENGERAIGTHPSDKVAQKVLTNGEEYFGEAEVLGEKYQTAYTPIWDDKENIVGMFYVGTSKKFFNEMLYGSLKSMSIIVVILTVLVFTGTRYFTQLIIINPLKLLTAETKKVASGDLSPHTRINSMNEIGELAQSINQMVEWMQALTYQISKATGASVPQESNGSSEKNREHIAAKENAYAGSNPLVGEKEPWGVLPKGLNEATLQQIVNFLKNAGDRKLSVSEIAEDINLTKVTIRRYLDFIEKCGMVKVELQYGPIGRPLKLYKLIE
ncbi:cache domain-containing protein [Desulfoscipio sp. XC116]|uniref:cache domain-containing protein n=1 Tax=Desulfoscipio sp. XC116 TaxID=3144975 RepID=UPI00325B57B9